MECYNEFAHIYDDLINSDIDYSSWSDSILRICSELNVNKEHYLDLACGTGNITEHLIKHFKYNFAVDLSEDMLSEAEKKMSFSPYKPKLICQDICDLNLNCKFDLITCCLDSVNYILEENMLTKFFTNVKRHLKDNGIFIFDINTYYKISEILGDNIFTYDSEDVFYVWENSFENEIVDMYLTFFVKQGKAYKRVDEEHRERAYSEEKIEDILCKCKLRTVMKLNNYETRLSVNEESVERITFIVKGE